LFHKIIQVRAKKFEAGNMGGDNVSVSDEVRSKSDNVFVSAFEKSSTSLTGFNTSLESQLVGTPINTAEGI
jgi:hypothetical protein